MRRLVLIFITIAGVLAVSAPADAAPPERETFEVNDTFFAAEASAMCGVPIEVSVNGTVSNTLFFDRGGDLDRVLQRLDLSQTFTNLDSGVVLNAPNVGATVHVDIGAAPDGRNLVRITGLEGQIIIPGVGSVIQDAGQTLLAGLPGTEPTILAQNGHFEGGGGPFPGACEFLQ